ncbi:Glyoxylate/succinic semialdehyde reductase 2, chloroplastic, partial [Tolypocladium ophioglossoides CBS 100239]
RAGCFVPGSWLAHDVHSGFASFNSRNSDYPGQSNSFSFIVRSTPESLHFLYHPQPHTAMERAFVPGPSGPRLGWIGLGSMGYGMATNLTKHLSQAGASSLQYYNRTMERGLPLQSIGAVPATSIVELVTHCDVIFLSLSDDAALEATVQAILGGASDALRGKIVVDTSTVHPDTSGAVQEQLAAKGAKFVAAPVFGASPVAAQGQLLWILAGDGQAIATIKPFIVGVMGRAIIELGEDVKQAVLLKTAGNFMTAGMMELVAEAHVFAEKTGLGTEAMESLIDQQYGPLALSMSKRLTTGAYMPPRGQAPWSDLRLALKDVGHGIKCAEQAGSRLGVAELAMKNLTKASEFADKQGRSLDSSSMYGVLRNQAGLPFETDLVRKRDAE